ncbi:MAG: hypothetical protein EBR86_11330 [Planctomycetia bacterium]|nr:hypothetical protein [Planctomycetia bacterium]
MFFTGSNRLTNIAPTAYTLDGITFQSGAQSFTLTGSTSPTLTMLGDIVNQSGTLQTIGGVTNGTRLRLNYTGTSAVTRTIDTGTASIVSNAQLAGSSLVTVSKTGSGLLTINEAPNVNHNLFNSTLRVDQGEVLLRANLASAPLVVSSAGTLTTGSSVAGLATLTSSGTVNMVTNLSVSGSVNLASTSVTNFTLPSDSADAPFLNYGDNSVFGGTLNATLAGTYPDAVIDAPVVFNLFKATGGAAGGNFSAVNATYGGQTLSFTQGLDPDFPQKWVSSATTDGQYLTFDQMTGQMVVVPEPSTVVFAGIGAAMTGWHMLKKRRSRRHAARPTFEV